MTISTAGLVWGSANPTRHSDFVPDLYFEIAHLLELEFLTIPPTKALTGFKHVVLIKQELQAEFIAKISIDGILDVFTETSSRTMSFEQTLRPVRVVASFETVSAIAIN